MGSFFKKLLIINIAFTFISLGVLFTIHAGLGAGSWDILHLGITKITGYPLGDISIWVGLIILIFCIYLKEYPGIGTVLNIFVIGVQLDYIQGLHIIPTPNALPFQLTLLIVGTFTLGFGCFLYMTVGLAAGPRDTMMVALIKMTGKPLWIIRTVIEVSVTLGGILLGAQFGIGTILIAFTLGPIIQWYSNIFKIELSKVEHETIQTYFQYYRDYRMNNTSKDTN